MIKFYDYAVHNNAYIRPPAPLQKRKRQNDDNEIYTPSKIDGYRMQIIERTPIFAKSKIDGRLCVSLLHLTQDFQLDLNSCNEPIETNLLMLFIDKLQIIMVNVSRLNFTARVFYYMHNPVPMSKSSDTDTIDAESFRLAIRFMLRCDYSYAHRPAKLTPNNPLGPIDHRLLFSQFLQNLESSGYVNYYLELTRRFRIKQLDLVLFTSWATNGPKILFRYEREDDSDNNLDNLNDSDSNNLDNGCVISVLHNTENIWLAKITSNRQF